MSHQPKSFDCVELKNSIQCQLLEEKTSLGEVEFNHRQREWFETSQDALAVWWRSIREAKRTGTSRK